MELEKRREQQSGSFCSCRGSSAGSRMVLSLVLILFFRESYDRLYLDVFVSV
ncbi:putative disrupted in renal carcinoma protein 2 [Scophthalmus maximus]|uniref:Putative disrupted in renal carcinoma protein 2 n=1 Tax=Scophthalmus maximus TaxID=52904 RepID=A0A2U9CF59_SCOMX|nr:putative disrupted in renal carcinoma protein 2 [Scophthalmus maximus]